MEAERLWGAYRERLLGYVRSRVPANDAEDILQDILLKAWQGIGKLQDEAKLSSWLFRITRNTIVDHYRSRVPAESFDEQEFFAEDEEPNRAEQELATCLVPMIEHLPEKYRHAIRLAEIEGRKQQEIADAEGISISGAKSRVQRGREMLRALMEECCQIQFNAAGRVTDYGPSSECTKCEEC